MKKMLKLATAVLLLSTIASVAAKATDLSLKDPEPTRYAPVNWTGLSVAIQGGYQWYDAKGTGEVDVSELEDNDFKDNWTIPLDSDFTGLTGRLVIAYDQQLPGKKLVFGVRAWYGRSNADGHIFADGEGTDHTIRAAADYGVAARLGHVFGPQDRAMAYVVGGYKWGKYKVSGEAVDAGFVKSSTNIDGFVVGGGLEYAIAVNTKGPLVILGLEYEHTFATDSDQLSLVEGVSAKFDDVDTDSMLVSLRVLF